MYFQEAILQMKCNNGLQNEMSSWLIFFFPKKKRVQYFCIIWYLASLAVKFCQKIPPSTARPRSVYHSQSLSGKITVFATSLVSVNKVKTIFSSKIYLNRIFLFPVSTRTFAQRNNRSILYRSRNISHSRRNDNRMVYEYRILLVQ